MDTPNNQSAGTSQNQPQTSTKQDAGGGSGTDVMLAKRTAIRQELAVALMAVGGVLVAVLIWANFSNAGQ